MTDDPTMGQGTSKIIRSFDVPYLAGSSKTGGKTFIDRRVPPTLTVKGKTFDPAKYLAVHEQTEHPLMVKGQAYEVAHRQALKAERKAVEADGIKWSDYQEQMTRLAAKTQREKPTNPPKDLYVKPYPHTEAEFLKHGAKKMAAGGMVHAPITRSGMIQSDVPGRTDRLPVAVPPHAHIIPADVISGLGQGNSMAGDALMRQILASHSAEPAHRAAGGSATGQHVPIVVAGGEYVVQPKIVASIGGGDYAKGHKILDKFIVSTRQRVAKTMLKLPGPKP